MFRDHLPGLRVAAADTQGISYAQTIAASCQALASDEAAPRRVLLALSTLGKRAPRDRHRHDLPNDRASWVPERLASFNG
jgi:MoxR-like ATPase